MNLEIQGDSIRSAIRESLLKARIPHHKLTVFGTGPLCIHVLVKGITTAHRWEILLSSGFPGCKLQTVKTHWPKSGQENLAHPERTFGFRVACMYHAQRGAA